MDYPKFIESSQKEESISIQRVNYLHWYSYITLFIAENLKRPSHDFVKLTILMKKNGPV